MKGLQAYRVTGYFPRVEPARYGHTGTMVIAAASLNEAVATYMERYPNAQIQCINHIGLMFDPTAIEGARS